MNFNRCILIGLVVVLALIVKENFAEAAAKPFSHHDVIIFPEENFDDCFLDGEASMQPGDCKTLNDCPEILMKWQRQNVYPKTCYFIKEEQYVCCPKVKAASNIDMPLPSITILPSVETTTKSFLEQLYEDLRPSELECDLNQRAESTVVNGLPTKPDEFPFMAALGWTSNAGDPVWYRCGGAVLSNTYILTAAHCAEIGGAFATVVRVGGTNLTDPSVKDVKIKRFISHPDWKTTSIYNDIALVELEEPLQPFSVACLWTSPELTSKNVIALGYGHIQFAGASSDQLLKAPLKVVTQQFCDDFYRNSGDVAPTGIIDSHLCANDPDELRDTCQGDSGGPLIMETAIGAFKKTYLVGVTSFGLGCSGEPPSIYTRVSSYIDWIESVVWPRIDTRKS